MPCLLTAVAAEGDGNLDDIVLELLNGEVIHRVRAVLEFQVGHACVGVDHERMRLPVQLRDGTMVADIVQPSKRAEMRIEIVNEAMRPTWLG